ncbi:hypothetical protein NEOLI_004158 [Neolecta irregularis DAH-3]|uniref:Uncharacterized protein n=1 Tax=Neolecta irregularis (strain DAH-3) TaxID=1198029 RepID=A0A1U7LNZ8_NEOID|nr:hypothetical protein NEOLI_004158 [Neolecta irregularis DAH-3]|eukprot:OLL24374.1 hypothetical protein NEOLI_004158 [Neolecta irregularis DAH-3]
MGGLVAADVILSIVGDKPVEGTDTKVMWPRIIGLISFDTPYLGLNPRAIDKGKTLYDLATRYSSYVPAGLFSAKAAQPSKSASMSTSKSASISTSKSASMSTSKSASMSTGKSASKSKWGTYLAGAGVAALTAGVGAVAYTRREDISGGLAWVNSHLEFVGILWKGQDLADRMKNLVQLANIEFCCFYTVLPGTTATGERTFVNLPKEGKVLAYYTEQKNSVAKDEDTI